MFASSPAALLIIDVQQGFADEAYWGDNRNNPHAEDRIAELLTAWRAKNWTVFHIQHCSQNPRSPLHETHAGNAFHPAVTPIAGEAIIKKNVNSAFIGTTLQAQLEAQAIHNLVVVGLITNHCVSTTVRMAANLGFQTTVVSDATATFDRVSYDGRHFSSAEVHEISLANLHDEFATILNTSSILTALDKS